MPEVKMKSSLFAVMFAAATTLGFSSALAQDEQDDNAADSGAPQPEIVTSSWELTFEHTTPATVSVEAADGTVTWYWYMTYSVFNDRRTPNNNDEPILFIPEIVVADDNGRIVHANRGIGTQAYDTVFDLVNNKLLMSPARVGGTILPGEDYIREGVAIWEVSDEDVDEFLVFVGGIYGETTPILHPVTGEPMMKPVIDPLSDEPEVDAEGNAVMEPLTVRRTLKLHYATPGTVRNPQRQTIRLESSEDVMR